MEEASVVSEKEESRRTLAENTSLVSIGLILNNNSYIFGDFPPSQGLLTDNGSFFHACLVILLDAAIEFEPEAANQNRAPLNFPIG